MWFSCGFVVLFFYTFFPLHSSATGASNTGRFTLINGYLIRLEILFVVRSRQVEYPPSVYLGLLLAHRGDNEKLIWCERLSIFSFVADSLTRYTISGMGNGENNSEMQLISVNYQCLGRTRYKEWPLEPSETRPVPVIVPCAGSHSLQLRQETVKDQFVPKRKLDSGCSVACFWIFIEFVPGKYYLCMISSLPQGYAIGMSTKLEFGSLYS